MEEGNVVRFDIWLDGSCKPKKISNNKYEKIGESTIAIVVINKGKIIHKYSQYVGILDNNQVEYEALLCAIQFAIDNDLKDVRFYTDSNLVERQMNNYYRCLSSMLIPYYTKAKNLISLIPNYQIKWVSRKSNKEADRLCRKEFQNIKSQIFEE